MWFEMVFNSFFVFVGYHCHTTNTSTYCLQADATIESVEAQGDIPCDVITISTVDEYNIAKLMFSYQLLVSAIGEFLQINTYNPIP
jgi:glucose-6-phosphate isomerase